MQKLTSAGGDTLIRGPRVISDIYKRRYAKKASFKRLPQLSEMCGN